MQRFPIAVVMLLVAGLLEGFGRQLITADLVRYGVGAGGASDDFRRLAEKS